VVRRGGAGSEVVSLVHLVGAARARHDTVAAVEEAVAAWLERRGLPARP